MARKEDLTDEQWAIIGPLIPEVVEPTDGKGRPRVHDDRSVMNGILWVLRTGELPNGFPSSSTHLVISFTSIGCKYNHLIKF